MYKVLAKQKEGYWSSYLNLSDEDKIEAFKQNGRALQFAATTIQKIFKGNKERNKFKKLQSVAIKIQRIGRGYNGKKQKKQSVLEAVKQNGEAFKYASVAL